MNAQNTILLTGRNARAAFVQVINNAHKSIDFLSYAISPAPVLDSTLQQTVWHALMSAPKRGLQCRAVIARHAPASPHEANNDAAASFLHNNGWTVARYPLRPVMHAKLILVDGHKVITGSHNLTAAAMEHNRELSTLTNSAELAADALEWFTTIYRSSTLHGTDQRPG